MFESRTAREGALGDFPATAATLIFAQSQHPRNRQFGWVRAPAALISNGQIASFGNYKQFNSCPAREEPPSRKELGEVTPLTFFVALAPWPFARDILIASIELEVRQQKTAGAKDTQVIPMPRSKFWLSGLSGLIP